MTLLKNAFYLFLCLSFSTAQSAEEKERPKVRCQLNYATYDEHGILKSLQRGVSVPLEHGKEISLEKGTFKLTASFKENCGSEGTNCDGTYDIKSAITQSSTISSTVDNLDLDAPNYRQYLRLKIGNEEAFSYCDRD